MVRNQFLVAVDDDPDILKLMNIVAGQLGFEYHGALSGEDCLPILATVTPSILVLDIEMPGLNGFETYEEIKRSHPGSKYPIIFHPPKKMRAVSGPPPTWAPPITSNPFASTGWSKKSGTR